MQLFKIIRRMLFQGPFKYNLKNSETKSICFEDSSTKCTNFKKLKNLKKYVLKTL